ncbi:hypothetical protein ACEYYA_07730 [Paracoccus sp. p3-h83]|uniref:hypothetical protein n=1 Tax=Paracoccus sp. p3-h83 TaxID=3342805 RepID=UPI0035B84CE5
MLRLVAVPVLMSLAIMLVVSGVIGFAPEWGRAVGLIASVLNIIVWVWVGVGWHRLMASGERPRWFGPRIWPRESLPM